MRPSRALMVVNQISPRIPQTHEERVKVTLALGAGLFTLFGGDGRATEEDFVQQRWASYLIFARDAAEHVSFIQYQLMLAGPAGTDFWRSNMGVNAAKVARARFAELDHAHKGYLVIDDIRPDAVSTFRSIDTAHKGYLTEKDVKALER